MKKRPNYHRYEEMLYPQYEHEYTKDGVKDKTITPELWDWLQVQASDKLKNKTKYAVPSVVSHWESIMNGTVPFGWKVEAGDKKETLAVECSNKMCKEDREEIENLREEIFSLQEEAIRRGNAMWIRNENNERIFEWRVEGD